MPSERAAHDDFFAAAEHIRKLMSIIDEIDELIPCGWLSKEAATRIREIPDFLFRCALDEHPLVRTLRDSVESLLVIFNEDWIVPKPEGDQFHEACVASLQDRHSRPCQRERASRQGAACPCC